MINLQSHLSAELPAVETAAITALASGQRLSHLRDDLPVVAADRLPRVCARDERYYPRGKMRARLGGGYQRARRIDDANRRSLRSRLSNRGARIARRSDR